MGTYKAFPERFATTHPRYLTPSYALIAAGIGSALFYSIRFYYGLTAFVRIWYFRHELFADVKSFVLKLLFQRLTRLRQRREHLRCRSGDPGSWDDPARRGGHAGHARPSAGVLPRGDPAQGHAGARRRRAIAVGPGFSACALQTRRRGGLPCQCGRSHPRPSAWEPRRSTGSGRRTQTASARTKSCRPA
jgi:hypothetical protein